MFPLFHLAPVINLSRNKNICCGLKKGVAKSRALVNFEQQILALFLVFHRTHNLSRNKYSHITSTPTKLTNQRAAFLQPATSFIVVRQGDHTRWRTGNIDSKPATKQCLRVFVSRISPPWNSRISEVRVACAAYKNAYILMTVSAIKVRPTYMQFQNPEIQRHYWSLSNTVKRLINNVQQTILTLKERNKIK